MASDPLSTRLASRAFRVGTAASLFEMTSHRGHSADENILQTLLPVGGDLLGIVPDRAGLGVRALPKHTFVAKRFPAHVIEV